ncbi:hypothetical protein [Spirosoma sp. KNUC1025]|uniref:hypothetical protein n=1 Tax=Spirosoma sp. KNUC1025 TaxID=2894082 RepID=UPI00386AA3CE|nr:hypothetical protein LN737_18465 [Spirosoma sp. KNUC1025]
MSKIYNYAWFVGFFVSGGVYLGLMRTRYLNTEETNRYVKNVEDLSVNSLRNSA